MIQKEYEYNARFREYVDKYCKKHGISVEEALGHEIVRQVFLMYMDL